VGRLKAVSDFRAWRSSRPRPVVTPRRSSSASCASRSTRFRRICSSLRSCGRRATGQAPLDGSGGGLVIRLAWLWPRRRTSSAPRKRARASAGRMRRRFRSEECQHLKPSALALALPVLLAAGCGSPDLGFSGEADLDPAEQHLTESALEGTGGEAVDALQEAVGAAPTAFVPGVASPLRTRSCCSSPRPRSPARSWRARMW
jgi:hypothetical protein